MRPRLAARAAHLLLDDEERILQRHSSIRSVFEFKIRAAARLAAATAARHPRWKRARASAARSSVGTGYRARPGASPEEWCARWNPRSRELHGCATSPTPSSPVACGGSARTDGVREGANSLVTTPPATALP